MTGEKLFKLIPVFILSLNLVNLANGLNWSRQFGLNLNNFEESNDDGASTVDKAKTWLRSMKKEIPDMCRGDSNSQLDTKLQLVKPVPCHEPGAIERYSFTGQLDAQLKLSGRGLLKIGPDMPKMARCISVLRLFNEDIESIESEFDNGIPEDRALIQWKMMKGEVLLNKGMPQGSYRVERDGIWTVGTIRDARVRGPCWIVLPTHVFAGICEDDPWSFSRQNHSMIQVFMHDMNVAVIGPVFDNNEGKNLLMAQEMEIGKATQIGDCTFQVEGNGHGRMFEFDLDSLTRKYYLENSTTVDYCAAAGAASNGQIAEGDEQVSNALRAFMTYMREISLDPSPIDKKRSTKFLSYLEKSDEIDSQYEAVITLHESVPVEFNYFGNFDNEGLFHGQAVLKPTTYQSCYKGKCSISKYGQIFGTFEHGVLQGLVVISSPDKESTTYFVVKDGIIHSLVIEMGLKPIYPFIIDPLHMQHNSVRSFTNNGIAFIGIFRNGKADGPVWYGMVGEPHIAQGFLYGQLNKKGKLTGDNIAYIYPDYVTALVGKFEDKIMKSGRESTIIQMTCKDGIIQASFSQPAEDSVEFFYDPSNNKYMGAMPLVRDPYEKKNVELQESRIPGAGHGIFAIRNILKGQVVALYNGMNYNGTQRNERTASCKANGDGSKEAAIRCMKYRINGYYGALSDIPEEYDFIDIYNATLAHKTNNNFGPYVNTVFAPMEHPRFGLIVTVTANRNITIGEEILVDYGYGASPDGVTDWYLEQKNQVFKELEEKEKQAKNEKEANKTDIVKDEH